MLHRGLAGRMLFSFIASEQLSAGVRALGFGCFTCEWDPAAGPCRGMLVLQLVGPAGVVGYTHTSVAVGRLPE